jgi:Zn-finger nucleic acid-binding protein
MSNSLEERGRALEEEYFRRKEREAIEKLRAKMTEAERAKAAEASALRCPKCDSVLEGVIHDAVEIDICNTCGGAWLDAGELEQLSKRETGGWLSNLWRKDEEETRNAER